MYSVLDLQKLVQMLNFLSISSGTGPAHSVLLGGNTNAAPGAAGTLLASNGPSSDPSFQTLAALSIQPALGYTPAHAGANSDITSLSSPALGAATATTAAAGTSNTQVATTAFVTQHSPIPNILDYGGDPTGVADNSTALANALAAGPSGKAAVFFPPGTYAFSSTASYTLPTSTASVTIMGAGADVTNLVWAGGGGLSIALNGPSSSAHIRDLSILAGSVNVGNGLILSQSSAIPNPANTAPSDITGVTLRGSDGYAATNYWQNAINISGASNVNLIGVNIVGSAASAGVGLLISGPATAAPVQINVTGATIQYLTYGIYYGANTQGLTVSQSNFTGAKTGIYSPASVVGLDQLTVFGNQFNCTIAGISTNTAIPNTQIDHNLFIVQNNGSAIDLGLSYLYSIVGNNINAGGTTNMNGIVIGTNSGGGGVITGNNISGMAGGSGIWLQSGSSAANVQSNAYSVNGANITNNGTGNTLGGGSQ